MYVLDAVSWRYLSHKLRMLLNSLVRNGSTLLSAGVLAESDARRSACCACRAAASEPIVGERITALDRVLQCGVPFAHLCHRFDTCGNKIFGEARSRIDGGGASADVPCIVRII